MRRAGGPNFNLVERVAAGTSFVESVPAADQVIGRSSHRAGYADVSPSSDADSKTDLRELGGYHLLHWTQNNMSYWAVSDVDPNDLRTFANLIRGK